MQLNLKSAKNAAPKDGEFTPIAPGRYDFVIEDAKQKTAQSGNEVLEVTLKVTGPQFINRKMWHSLSLLETAQGYLVKFLEAAGVGALTEQDNVSVDEIAAALVGRTINGYIDIKNSSTGVPRNKVDNFKAPDNPATPNIPMTAAPLPAAAKPKPKLFT